jgi:hypothetical protein
MSKRARQASQAQRKLEEMRRQQQARQRLQRLLIGAGALVVIAVIAVVIIVVVANRPSSTANAGTGPATGATVDGIKCQTNEQAVFHIHSHLAIFDNGAQQPVPHGIGIPGPQTVQSGFVTSGKCFYWLHTHDASGVIHIESPVHRTYTLGQFFDIWGRKLSSDQVGSAKGQVTAYVNGKRYSGDPRSIQLGAHAVIQLDVGKVVPPKPYTFATGL